MKKFERFIIYPLLIVALFYSFAGEQVTTVAQDVMDKLIVREISVVDNHGKEVINITGDGEFGNGRIFLHDKDSSYNDSLLLTNYSIILRDKDYFNTFYSNEIRIREQEPNGGFSAANDLIRLGSSKGGRGLATFYNSKGNESVIITSGNDDHGAIELNNPNRDRLISIGANANGHGLINVYDKYGEDWRSYGFK